MLLLNPYLIFGWLNASDCSLFFYQKINKLIRLRLINKIKTNFFFWKKKKVVRGNMDSDNKIMWFTFTDCLVLFISQCICQCFCVWRNGKWMRQFCYFNVGNMNACGALTILFDARCLNELNEVSQMNNV